MVNTAEALVDCAAAVEEDAPGLVLWGLEVTEGVAKEEVEMVVALREAETVAVTVVAAEVVTDGAR